MFCPSLWMPSDGDGARAGHGAGFPTFFGNGVDGKGFWGEGRGGDKSVGCGIPRYIRWVMGYVWAGGDERDSVSQAQSLGRKGLGDSTHYYVVVMR